MTRLLFILLAVLTPLPLDAGAPREQKPPRGTTVRVSIQKMKFNPATVSVRPGDTVTWVNNDQHDHTVEAADRSFASGTISPGETYSHKVTREGTINYTCSLHPRMRGALNVK